MPAASRPANEPDRLSALHALDLPDLLPAPALDRIAAIAADLAETPIVTVSLMDTDRKLTIAAVGVPVGEMPRDETVCSHVIAEGRTVAIGDLAEDPRTADNPNVACDNPVRFYIGAPIALTCGHVVGALCAMGPEARPVDPDTVRRLEDLAALCAIELETRVDRAHLVRARQTLRSIQNAAPVGMLRIEPVRDHRTRIEDFRILEANAAAGKILGRPAVSIQSSTLLDQLAALQGSPVFEMLSHVSESGDSDWIEHEYADRRFSAALRFHAVCVPEGLLLTIEDITQSVSHRRELLAQDQLLRQFIRHTPAPIAMFDTQMRYLIAADQWREDYSLGDAVLEGRSHYEVFPDLDEKWKALHRRALAGETIYCELDRYEPEDAKVRFLRYQYQPWRDASGEIGGILAFIEDITPRVARERKIEQALHLLEQTERVSGVGGWSFDVARNELFWTPQVYTIHGLTAEYTPTPESGIEFYTDQSRPMIERLFARSIEHAEPFDAELEIRRADGVIIPVRAMGQPVVHDGRVVHVAGSFQDLSVQKAREARESREAALLEVMSLQSKDLIFAKDLEGRFTMVNPAFERFCGKPADRIIGKTDFEVMPLEIATLCRDGDAEAIARREPIDLEEQVETPAGTVHFLTTKQPHVGPDGRVHGVIGVSRDVTEYHTLIAEARRSQESLQFALHAADGGFWDHDLVTDTVHYSDSWYSMLGYEPQEFTATPGLFWDVLLDARDVDRVRDAHDAYLCGEAELYHEEIRLTCKNGSSRWVLDVGRVIERDDRGRPLRMVGVHIDIDERKREHDRLQTALRAMRSGLWEWDLSDNTCLFDDEWFSVLGYEPGELPQAFETWESLCHPDDLLSAKTALGTYLAGSSDRYAFEHRLWTKQGTWKWVLGTGTVTSRDTEGRPLRVVGVNIDFDERRKADEQLADALFAAEHANRAKSQFLANMSHEIRTPMTAILGYTELILAETRLEPAQREMISTIYRNGEHLLSLINDILDLSKIEAGKMTIEQIEFSPAEVLLGVRELMAERAAAKGIRFELDGQSRIPERMMGDPVRLRQILVNLVGNAIKFTAEGSVVVTARPVWSETTDATRLLIDVRDTGVGMKPDHIDLLFKPFQQADESMTRRFGGTGLGLSISQRLAQLLGGRILVESECGRGSTFTVALDVSDALPCRWVPLDTVRGELALSRDPTPVPSAGALSLDARVLLAEDGADNQRLIAHHLRRAGAEVAIVENGRLALEAVADSERAGEPFDLVVMDMQMPEMDGYAASTELRRRGVTIPILALTAHAMDGDRERCIAAGCDEYLSKPVDRAKLVAACDHWTGRMSDRWSIDGDAPRAA
ncbi:MAG: PAS domain-containing protein [Planctomycetota bacterium]